MEIIKSERINNAYGIVLMYYGREMGYEIAISSIYTPDAWHETDGLYSTKRSALKQYNIMPL